MSEKDARNEAYRDSRCVSCKTERYSAGRTRCEACHQIYATGGGVDG